jgi:hypothetical protein
MVMEEIEGWTLDTRPQWQDRRGHRSEDRREAMRMQLDYVCEALSLDAIVLADDLGTPIAASGDSELASLLAVASMWTSPDDASLDPVTLELIRSTFPVRDHEVAFQFVKLPGQDGLCRIVATGKSQVRMVGVQHVTHGLHRIASTCA